MLSWLKGDKVDHPLANAKEARRLLDALPAKDPLKALEEAVDWLASVNETEGFKLDRRFEVIDQIDGATRKAQDRLRRTYLALKEHEQIQERRICKVATDFWDTLGQAYLQCVKQAQDTKAVPGAFKSRVPLLAARTTRALRHQMHWVLLQAGVMRAGFWSDIALAANLAEAAGGADALVELYEDGGGASSERYEFLRTMMFWAASPSGLSPVEQVVAERLVVHLTSQFLLDARPWEGCEYCFSLDAALPPLRYGAAIQAGAATRYFSAGAAWQSVQQLAAEASSGSDLPPHLNWGPSADAPTVARMLKHVGLNWAKEMPARSSVRRKTALRLLVVHGYPAVLGAIDPSAGEGLDFSGALAHESWIAEDVSNGGYGVVVPAGKGDWLRVGVLVAVRTETDKSWDIAIIRRVKSDEHRQHRAGIQLISKSAMPVTLRKLSGMGLDQTGKPQIAILLGARPSRTGSLHLVARRDLFNGRESLEASYGNPADTVTLDPSGIVESGQDFDWLRYKLLASVL